MNKVFTEDYQKLSTLSFIDWEQFRNSTVLVTGATGLIGLNLVRAFSYASEAKALSAKILVLVRNTEAAKVLFPSENVTVLPYELGTSPEISEKVDYIVHLASPTSSNFFMEKPVDTLLANIEGTKALLEWAKEHPVKKFIMVSTMEVYGFPERGHKVTEKEVGGFLPQNSRNSYPVGKIATEALCYGYFAQYGVPTVVLRATQTFGPGVKYDDGRVFAQFMRCVMEKKDIVLRSLGLTERCYLYTADAVSAILLCLLKGQNGEAYTVANPGTYCSISDMAKEVADKLSGGEISVKFDVAEDITKLGYAETLYMDLDTSKIEGLGWKAQYGLMEMFERMMRGMKDDE